MGQFDFLGTWNDSWNLLGEILKRNDVKFVPDLKFNGPKPLYITYLDEEAKEVLRDRRNLYIWGSFSIFPPCLDRIEEGQNAGKYSVWLAGGGPGLGLTLPACYEEGGLLNLGTGDLSYPKFTFNPNTNLWEPPSPALKAGYKDIKARIKRHLVRHKLKTFIWIGKEALQLVKQNKAKITGFELPL